MVEKKKIDFWGWQHRFIRVPRHRDEYKSIIQGSSVSSKLSEKKSSISEEKLPVKIKD